MAANADYTMRKSYTSVADCKAGGPTQTQIGTISTNCVTAQGQGGVQYLKYFCTGSKYQYQAYTDNTCATKTSQAPQDDPTNAITCDANMATFSCNAGSWTPPGGTINMDIFTSNTCATPFSSGATAYSYNIPDNSCLPDGKNSVLFKCSSGTTVSKFFNGSTTCASGSSPAVDAPANTCSVIPLQNLNVKATCTSGASTTSVAFLAVITLVLATLTSSAM